MIRKFLSLEWKQFFRSPNLSQNAGITVLLSFLAFFYGIYFIILSVQLYGILQDSFPATDPLVSANRFVLYWLFFDLTVRHFFQKISSLDMSSLLVLNIRKSKIIHYVLQRSFFSFLNLIAAFASIPFAFTLLYKGYATSQIFTWLGFLVLATMIVNYLHILITSKEGVGKEYVGLGFVVFFAITVALDYFHIFSLGALFGQGINTITQNPYLLIIPFVLLLGSYSLAFKALQEQFYLDAILQVKHKNRKTSSLSWVEHFGGLAPLLKKDLRMIWRSKRTKGLLIMSLLFLFYGLIFYKTDKEQFNFMVMFVGMFMTGIFIYNFGMYVPSWDGAYFQFLMTQDISMKSYLKSKYLLLVASACVAFILTIPYVYFGWEVLLIHFAGFIYNIGLGVIFVLYYGSFRRKAMDLNSRASFNYQGISGMDMLIIFPLLFAPMIIFGLLQFFLGIYVAVGIFVFLGILGLLFRERFLDMIAKRYQTNKYKMLTGFAQK